MSRLIIFISFITLCLSCSWAQDDNVFQASFEFLPNESEFDCGDYCSVRLDSSGTSISLFIDWEQDSITQKWVPSYACDVPRLFAQDTNQEYQLNPRYAGNTFNIRYKDIVGEDENGSFTHRTITAIELR